MHLCRNFACLVLLPLTLGTVARAQSWIAPTPEELKMTSIPEQPGAKAVVLNVDEVWDDDLHMRSYYKRIKILTDAGKDLGDVRLFFNQRSDGNGWTVDDVAGRTIQPDGTIVPFTGKPYDQVLDKSRSGSFHGKSFSMPAVEVGSIVEYRYKLRWDSNVFQNPTWDIQDSDLFIRKAHYMWKPTEKDLITNVPGREASVSALTWHPVLPPGQELKVQHLPGGRRFFELTLTDVPAFSSEAYMPPISSSLYRVEFYYTPYRTPQEYWQTEGKYWSSDANKFVGNSDFVRTTAQQITAGATTDEDKLRKIYAYTQTIQNTDYTRAHDAAEDKGEGLKETKSVEDVIHRMRGNSNEITRTFVALARAAGMNASLMLAGNRSHRIVDVNWLALHEQLQDEIAIVNYGGTDHFFDPGRPYTAFGHLHWTHTSSGGVRQFEKETQVVQTPAESYKFSRTARVADLKLDATGNMTGTITLTWQGSPAVTWRERALRGDTEGLREELKKNLEHMMPGGTEVTVRGIEGLTDSEQPLKVLYAVNGRLGTPAGSRVMLPADIFVESNHNTFPHEKRDQPVYFQYAQAIQDAMRITVPDGYTIEAAPKDDRVMYKTDAVYSQRAKQTGNSVTVWRDFTMADFYFPIADYKELRTFYNAVEQHDHNAIVLKQASGEKASLQ